MTTPIDWNSAAQAALQSNSQAVQPAVQPAAATGPAYGSWDWFLSERDKYEAKAASPVVSTPVDWNAAAHAALSPSDGQYGAVTANPYVAEKASPAASSAIAPIQPTADSGLISSNSTPTQWGVTPNMTVQQQASDIIGADGTLMQQARSAAMQQMNARGLVNSSMGIGAGQQAVLNTAVDIGKQDANTYASAGQFNTGQTNTWNNSALDRAQAVSEKSLDRVFNSGENSLDRTLTTTQNDANRTFTAGQSALDRNLSVTQKELDRASTTSESALNRGFTAAENTANRAAEVAKYNFDATTRTSLAGLANTYDSQMQKDSSVAQAYNNTVSQMGAIDGDPNLEAPAKSVAKNRLIASFEAYAKVRGLNMDLVFEKFVEGEDEKEDAKTTGLINTASGGGFDGGGGDAGSSGGGNGGAGSAGNGGGDGGPGGVGGW